MTFPSQIASYQVHSGACAFTPRGRRLLGQGAIRTDLSRSVPFTSVPVLLLRNVMTGLNLVNRSPLAARFGSVGRLPNGPEPAHTLRVGCSRLQGG